MVIKLKRNCEFCEKLLIVQITKLRKKFNENLTKNALKILSSVTNFDVIGTVLNKSLEFTMNSGLSMQLQIWGGFDKWF